MKKIIFSGVAILLLSIGTSFRAQSSDASELSVIKLANIEALANTDISQDCKWKRNTDNYGCTYHTYVIDGNGNLCPCRTVSNDLESTHCKTSF